MSKTKTIILLLILFSISLVFALKWGDIIEAVDKAYKTVGLKTPSYILTIIEKESGFGENLGNNLGSKEENLKRCVNMCYWTEEKNKLNGKKLAYCFDKEKQEYTIEARTQWCNNQYSALEKITSNLGLDINEVPFSPDFGIGYTQFQPTTWLQYKELKNKNPWNLEDSLYAAALKLKYDGVNENEEGAIERYNRNPKYISDYKDKRQEWDQILNDTIFVYDCPSNNFSCALSIIKTNYSECTENNWSIKKKKECIKTKVVFQKEQKLAQKQKEKQILVYEIQILETKESTPFYIQKAQNLLTSLIDLFTGKQTSSINNQNNQENIKQTILIPSNDKQIIEKIINENNNNNQQENINYKEEKKEITIIIKDEKSKEIKKTTLDLSNIDLNLINNLTIQTSTQVKTINQNEISNIRQQIIPLLNQNFSQSNYSNGGGGAYLINTTNNINKQKDLCEDYKNKNYPKIIINEIQFETSLDTKDEFIELYNPNNEEVDLTCWKLEKYASKQNSTSTPSLTTLIPSSKFQGKIKPNSYFLITSSSTKEKYQGDLSYAESYSISENNVIILRKPNGEISDLVGYGDDKEKIYQYENLPFIFENNVRKVCNQSAQSVSSPNQSECIYKSIQRKNFQDTDDNSKDFWLHKPSPKNSSITEFPREDFIDLTNITIQNFNVNSTSTEDGYFLNISFNEPIIQTISDLTQTLRTGNYSYELLISTSTIDEGGFNTDKHEYSLNDFGITSTLPLPKFDSSTTSLSFEINKCPTTSTTYYFALFLKDNLDEENKSNLATSSVTLPEDLCNPGESILVQNISTTTTSTGKILFSEIYIKEGTSTGEFIELYNPNEFNIDLTGWEIKKINKNGKEQTIIPSSKFKGIIPSFSYFLLVNNNTSSEISIDPDFIYPKSYDLAKDNALILIDKEGKIIDQVCWGNVPNFQNCNLNPNQSTESALSPNQFAISLQRKKTATSTPDTTINQNLGNAYFTNNSSNDFLYAQINPENSSILKPTIRNIQNFQINNQGKIYNISWFSPAYYDENLNYEVLISTSSDSQFQIITSTPFRILDNQFISFNLCPFIFNLPINTNLNLKINLVNQNNQILTTTSTLIKSIDCSNFNLNFYLIEQREYTKEQPFPGLGMAIVRKGLSFKYKILDNLNLRKITMEFPSICGIFDCHSVFIGGYSVKIFKSDLINNTTTLLFDNSINQKLIIDPWPSPYISPLKSTLIIEPLESFNLNKNDEIIIEIYVSTKITLPNKINFEGEILD
jgi:hypothetical protein